MSWREAGSAWQADILQFAIIFAGIGVIHFSLAEIGFGNTFEKFPRTTD